MQFETDADRLAMFAALGGSTGQVAGHDVRMLYDTQPVDIEFDSAQVRSHRAVIYCLSSDAKRFGFKADDEVQIAEGDFLVAEPPIDESGVTTLVLRKS